MSSYVITGVSRGIGWAFLSNLSSNSENTVIGFVRNKPATEERIAKELGGRSNVHILEADMSDYKSIQAAAEEVGKITGGSLDYVIANAAISPLRETYKALGELASDPVTFEKDFIETFQTNVVGNVHLITALVPFVLKGTQKKITAISSGIADIELVRKYDLDVQPIYAASKAALNAIMAKFSTQYARDGILFLSISPGMVDVGSPMYANMDAEQTKRFEAFVGGMRRYSPNFGASAKPEDSVRDVLSVIESSSLLKGDGGAFKSHWGTQQWL